MKLKQSIFTFVILFGSYTIKAQKGVRKPAKVDYEQFIKMSGKLAPYRSSRLIDIETFNAYSANPNTIILDTRSKKGYGEIHIKGAIHLNFSDFTEKSLETVIPNKTTRILIYCNNNFESPKKGLMNKMTPLALNIPTFINLYGYGYENIYELKDYLDENDPRIQFESTVD